MCHLPDDVQKVLFYTGTWEPTTSKLISEELRVGETFLDVGANVGHFSLLAARRVGPSGRVVSVEASSSTAQALRTNVDLNELGSVITICNVAASDHEHEATLHSEDQAGAAYLRHLNPKATGGGVEVVKAVPLDSLIPDARPSVVKIDIEGADFRALLGMKNLLERSRCRLVVVETEEDNLSRFGDSVDDVLGFMRDLGYSASRLASPGHADSRVFRLDRITLIGVGPRPNTTLRHRRVRSSSSVEGLCAEHQKSGGGSLVVLSGQPRRPVDAC